MEIKLRESNKVKFILISVFIFFVFLTSCTPTTENIEGDPTSTKTISPSITSSPTITPEPTYTPTISSTSTPTSTPTLIPNDDQDQDGLSNISELFKYHTDPYNPDSDGDGIIDSDWDERREYAYSVRAFVKIRQPYDIDAMNDMFQDVRVLSEEDYKGYTEIEIIIYPETKLKLFRSPYPIGELPEDLIQYTEPGISTNYSQEMQAEVKQIVRDASTDWEAVSEIILWIDQNTSLADFPYQPEVFYYTYLYNNSVYMRNQPTDLSVSKMFSDLFYADSMFKQRVHGTCGSTATLKCSMIKAAGIPCKIIQTLFPIFSHQDQLEEYQNNLSRPWPGGDFENQPSGRWSWSANHFYLEVFIGNQWVRVDRNINIYIEGGGLNFKTLSVPDITDVDFSLNYPLDWVYNRPYYTTLLDDQEPIH